jgi:hypothetical protein
MSRVKIFLLLFLGGSLFFSLGAEGVFAQEDSLFASQIEDKTFYNDFCSQGRWLWLCQGEAFSLPALKEKDSWFYFSQDFFDGQGSEEEIIVSFDSLAEEPALKDLFLEISLKSVTDSIGAVELWLDWGQGWLPLGEYPEDSWLIFAGLIQDKEFDLANIFPDMVLSSAGSPWRLKVKVKPLVSSQPVMLAIDRILIKSSSLVIEPSLAPTLTPAEPTPTLSISPTPIASPTPQASSLEAKFVLPEPKGKIYFRDSVILGLEITASNLLANKVVFQLSTDKKSWQDAVLAKEVWSNNWQGCWYPPEEGSFYLRAKVYYGQDDFALFDHPDLFVFDQTPPVVSWESPSDGDDFGSPLKPQLVIDDSLAGVEEEPRFFYRYRDGAWQEIADFPWYFSDNLALGDYYLRAQVSDLAGNQTQSEITLFRRVKIFGVFMVDKTLFWQTSHPVFSRVVYGPQSLSAGGLDEGLPNLGYPWASDQLNQQEATSHQYALPSLPPGEYFYCLLALGEQTGYSPEFSFKTENFLASIDNSKSILGKAIAAGPVGEQELSPTTFESDLETDSSKIKLNWLRLAVIFVLALSLGGAVVYYQLRGVRKG